MEEIGRFNKAVNKQIVVSIDEFENMEIVDIREFIEASGLSKPTKRGIKFRKKLLDRLIELLKGISETA